ncbi:hypothetical protein J2W30_006686 [Variovorax boronicumulans]|nr:hypothetical protein [Variovorax boronicumulans]MDQ0610795.1 hypothetical protein [Variovorax sp. W1I1]
MPCALARAAGVSLINDGSENERADGVPCAAKSRRRPQAGDIRGARYPVGAIAALNGFLQPNVNA